ncbi:hypothetical protein J6590_044709 [Homalodisca vitripennis]|nr:hypothetical protein J6590_044709 [Homalodisca vitripennis]
MWPTDCTLRAHCLFITRAARTTDRSPLVAHGAGLQFTHVLFKKEQEGSGVFGDVTDSPSIVVIKLVRSSEGQHLSAAAKNNKSEKANKQLSSDQLICVNTCLQPSADIRSTFTDQLI